MRTNLAIMVSATSTEDPLWFYIPGQTILEEVSAAVTRFETQATRLPPGVIGTQDTPLTLKTPTHWMTAFTAMRRFRSAEFYFKVAGRVIKKWPDGHNGGHADGFYMSDAVLSGTTDTQGQIWSRENGASYREFAKFMASCMPTGNELTWSEDIAQKMRIVLGGGRNLRGQPGTSIYSALPLLCSVMFLAESARNKRAWMAALIMLDSIGRQYNRRTTTNPAKYYTWDRVLAHPERIDPGYSGSALLSKPQRGPTGRSGGNRGAPIGLAPLTKKRDLVSVEGKLPASPSGSASTGSTIDVANDYIQMKETSLAIRWLSRILNQLHPDYDVCFATWRDKDPLTGLTNLMNDGDLRTMASRPPCSTLKITLNMLQETRTSALKEIRSVLDQRCTSFDPM